MTQVKLCPVCGVSDHLPLIEREVDQKRYCIIYIKRWICTQCLEESIDEREYRKEEKT